MTRRPERWLIIDVVLYFILLGLGLSLGTMSNVTPKMAPISCSDPALQRPLMEDTFPIELVIVLCTLFPAISILLMELVLAVTDVTDNRMQPQTQEFRQTASTASPASTAFWRTAPLVWDLLVGELFAFCIMELLKITTGMPRPHFWASCGKEELCGKPENGSVTVNLTKCHNPRHLKWRHLADAAKSFPSGHSCLAVFSAVYMTAYIFQRFRPRNSGGDGYRSLARKWLPFPWFVMACLVTTSRLWDQRHHWWDLVGGGILGAIMAVLTVKIISRGFRRVSDRIPRSSEMPLNSINRGSTPELSST